MASTAASAQDPAGVDHGGFLDPDVRVTKRNFGETGNPFARKIAGLREAILDRVTPEDFAAVTDALVKQARDGNVSAAKLLFAYTLGKPAAPVNPDRLDVQEGKHFKDSARLISELSELGQVPDLKAIVGVMRILRDSCTEDVWNELLDGIRADKASAAAQAAKQAAPPSPNGQKQKRPAAATPPAQPSPTSWHVDMPIVTGRA